MDSGQAEMGILYRRGSHDLYNPSAGYQPVDPFTSSIAQVTRNRQNTSSITNINDISLPSYPSSHYPRSEISYSRSQPDRSHSGGRERDRQSRRYYDLESSHRTVPSPHQVQPSTPSTPIDTPVASWEPNVREGAVGSNDGPLDGSSVHRHYYRRHDSPIEGEPWVGTSKDSRHGLFEEIKDTRFPPTSPIMIPSSPVPSHNDAPRATNRLSRYGESPQQPNYRFSYPPAWPGRPVELTPPPLPDGEKNDSIPDPRIPRGVSPVTDATITVGENFTPILLFMTDILPRQIYLHLFLRLPSFYYSRVSRIFSEARLTLQEIHELALQADIENQSHLYHRLLETDRYSHSGNSMLPSAYNKLKLSWEHFIDNLLREWKTLNIISALLLSAITTMFQIHGAAEDPVTRYLAFWSLICALMSLLYGCSFIIRFASMRKVHKALEWAIEAQKMQSVLWNVWIMLSMPMVWITWSILAFIASIMSFMWRAKANLPPDYEFSVTASTEFGFRILNCIVLGLGVVYGILIIGSFRRYGAQMDDDWTNHVKRLFERTYSKPRTHSTPMHSSWSLPQSKRVRFARSTLSIPRQSPGTQYPVSHHGVPTSTPISSQSPSDDKAPSATNSPLASQPRYSWYSHAGTPEIEEKPRSKSTPSSLPRLSIPDNSNQNEATLPKFPEQQLHHSTSTSTRRSSPHHPMLSENTNLLPRCSERQLHRSASDNLSRHSLERHPIPVVKEPNNDNSSPRRSSYDFICSNCSPLATRHEEENDVHTHLTQTLQSETRTGGWSGSPLDSDKTEGRMRQTYDGSRGSSPCGMGREDG